jgi:hypothetical protein
MRRLAALAALLWAHAAAAMDEVPFVVTPDNVTLAMLQLAKVTSEDYLIDLGSGDGRIVILAAKRFGARGLGIEIVQDLVEQSRASARKAGVGSRALFRAQDLFETDLSPASVVTLYLLPEVNLALRPKLLRLRPGTRVVSHDWDMGDWVPDRTLTVDAPEKIIGLEKKSKVHLWVVPARLEGAWCGVGKARGHTLTLEQAFQQVRAELAAPGGEPARFTGKIHGHSLRAPGLTFHSDGTRLRATHAKGKYSALARATFTRRKGPSCG